MNYTTEFAGRQCPSYGLVHNSPYLDDIPQGSSAYVEGSIPVRVLFQSASRALEQSDGVIQVCFDVKKEETKKRQVRGLVEAMKKFKISRGLVVTEDYESEEKVGKKKIEFLPLWKWLLE